MNKQDQYSDEFVEALIDRAASPPEVEPLPAALAAKIVHDGKQIVGRQTERNRFADRVKRWWQQPILAWGVACAAVVLALLIGVSPIDSGTEPSLTAAQVDDLLASDTSSLQLSWSSIGGQRYDRVSGYVRWNNQTQQGVMRLRGLPVNDPGQAQYQLWIVDPERDENPIDGGVFNIESGENLISIDAKLAVLEPKAFAITLEQPGGVVVSDGPLLVIASG